jgi:hypothetical protein
VRGLPKFQRRTWALGFLHYSKSAESRGRRRTTRSSAFRRRTLYEGRPKAEAAPAKIRAPLERRHVERALGRFYSRLARHINKEGSGIVGSTCRFFLGAPSPVLGVTARKPGGLRGFRLTRWTCQGEVNGDANRRANLAGPALIGA